MSKAKSKAKAKPNVKVKEKQKFRCWSDVLGFDHDWGMEIEAFAPSGAAMRYAREMYGDFRRERYSVVVRDAAGAETTWIVKPINKDTFDVEESEHSIAIRPLPPEPAAVLPQVTPPQGILDLRLYVCGDKRFARFDAANFLAAVNAADWANTESANSILEYAISQATGNRAGGQSYTVATIELLARRINPSTQPRPTPAPTPAQTVASRVGRITALTRQIFEIEVGNCPRGGGRVLDRIRREAGKGNFNITIPNNVGSKIRAWLVQNGFEVQQSNKLCAISWSDDAP